MKCAPLWFEVHSNTRDDVVRRTIQDGGAPMIAKAVGEVVFKILHEYGTPTRSSPVPKTGPSDFSSPDTKRPPDSNTSSASKRPKTDRKLEFEKVKLRERAYQTLAGLKEWIETKDRWNFESLGPLTRQNAVTRQDLIPECAQYLNNGGLRCFSESSRNQKTVSRIGSTGFDDASLSLFKKAYKKCIDDGKIWGLENICIYLCFTAGFSSDYNDIVSCFQAKKDEDAEFYGDYRVPGTARAGIKAWAIPPFPK